MKNILLCVDDEWKPGQCFDHANGRQCLFSITGCMVKKAELCPLGNDRHARPALEITKDELGKLAFVADTEDSEAQSIKMIGQQVEVFVVEKK